MPVPVTVDADGVGRLSPPVESSLYYIASEAVTNAIKHATPDRIHNIFAKLGLQTDDGNRRVLAVLAYLRATRVEPAGGEAVEAR
ncbi:MULTISPECIES: hypothetical protein [unclassified Nonomuraea]|uniref:hypothetical protein n=1 Tax=unclassified Nonomuraea TaxID=2593643 RepID=UPI001F40F4B2|nr:MULTISPECIES: hypothetical protein [unclassified Nonomuraea]